MPDASTFLFEPSPGRMIVGSNIDNPEKFAATDRHMPVRSAGFWQSEKTHNFRQH